MNLKGKKAIVTGASRGIGRAIAKALSGAGINLFLIARDQKELSELKAELAANGTSVDFAAADLSDVAQIEKAFEKGVGFLGGIDILINNAGGNVAGPVSELAIKDWEKILSVNLWAPFLLSKLASKLMMAQGSGYIINIGSGASQTPIANNAAYCASKYGLLGFSESLALELRQYGIKVSIVLPGSTATHFGGSEPGKKLSSQPGILHAEDVADSVMYLLNQSPGAWTSVMNLRPLNPGKA